MEIIFELLLELLLQVAFEVLCEFGLHAAKEPFRKTPNPSVAAAGYTLLGIIVGGISLIVFPDHMVTTDWGRLLNLALTPVGAGLCMVALGCWRQKHHAVVLRLDRFSYGFLFALTVALIRYFWAQ